MKLWDIYLYKIYNIQRYVTLHIFHAFLHVYSILSVRRSSNRSVLLLNRMNRRICINWSLGNCGLEESGSPFLGP